MSHYGTLTDADPYHAARGRTDWAAATTVARTEALTRASDYIDGRYRYQVAGCWKSMFPGTKTGGRAQEREWPRAGAQDSSGEDIPDNAVPVEVDRAMYEAAYRELTAPGSLSPDYVPTEQVTKEKIGPIEVSYATPQGSGGMPPNLPVIAAVDGILSSLLCERGKYGVGVRVV